MKILLTGAGGMVGRNILARAASSDMTILAPRRSELDLLSFNNTEKYIRANRPDFVIHAAGHVGGIQANIREPVKFLSENWLMGNNIVLASRSGGIENLINLGSSCMYPAGQDSPLREEQVLSGQLEPTNEGYAIAKCAVARLCQYVTREDPEKRYKTLIPCNLYGEFDKFDPAVSHMIPAVVHKLHLARARNDEYVEIWGDGSARREFMFAADLADAILFAINNFDRLPEIMNVGVGKDFSIAEYYQIAAEVIGYQGRFQHDTSKPVGMRRKLLDVSQQTALGWQPRTALREGIRATYEYYLEKEA